MASRWYRDVCDTQRCCVPQRRMLGITGKAADRVRASCGHCQSCGHSSRTRIRWRSVSLIRGPVLGDAREECPRLVEPVASIEHQPESHHGSLLDLVGVAEFGLTQTSERARNLIAK